ncbi:MAG: hypothetical protein IPN00_11740 [Hydrogenophilales bacterium]|nr:hypothetical protein [Hydrogenophilales bacterium]
MVYIDELTGARAELAILDEMSSKAGGMFPVLPDAGWLAGVLDALAAHIAVLDQDGGIVAVNQA